MQEAWIGGVSTRRVDDLVQAIGLSGISKSQVSKLCKEIDERVRAFLDRPLAGEWLLYLWLDATYPNQREGGRISAAMFSTKWLKRVGTTGKGARCKTEVGRSIHALLCRLIAMEGRLAMLAMSFRLVLTGAAVSAVVPLAHAQLITHRDLSYSIAKTIAETAIDSCKANGYSVSAVVVDRAGEVIVALRGDNAGPHTMENARRKAYTARSFRTSTAAYAKRFADNDPVVRQQVTLPNVIAIPGGLPIKVGDDVIGGAAVSGSPGVDEPCVQAGLDKIADQLK
jgi:uncharacterized protein GlcG (DUF336 family)